MTDPTPQSVACYCATIRKIARALTRLYDGALEGTGLRVTQYALLSNIRRMEPVSFQSLSSAVALERTTLIRNLNLLRKQGLVHTDSESKVHTLTLTDMGRTTLEAARPYWHKAQSRVQETLSKEERALLNELPVRLNNIE